MNGIFIIAEAGVNHNGSLEIAKKLIDAAAFAGADAVKFQTFRTENLVCKHAQKAEYQQRNAQDRKESQYEMLKKLELTEDAHKILIEYCNRKKIMFLSTPFDIDSIKLLQRYDIAVMKIPSGEITNYPYLREIAKTRKRVILSTGVSELNEIKEAIYVLKQYGSKEITLLHCNTEYPTPLQDVNLRAMCTMNEELNLPVGYSDHTVGIDVPIAAAALGASVIEKHFTLNRNMEGPDHRASLEPDELKSMVDAIRNIEKALGDGYKRPTDSEIKNRNIVRKSIVAKVLIQKGEVFSEENLTTKRPGNGISPMQWNQVIGRKADKNYEPDDLISIKIE